MDPKEKNLQKPTGAGQQSQEALSGKKAQDPAQAKLPQPSDSKENNRFEEENLPKRAKSPTDKPDIKASTKVRVDKPDTESKSSALVEKPAKESEKKPDSKSDSEKRPSEQQTKGPVKEQKEEQQKLEKATRAPESKKPLLSAQKTEKLDSKESLQKTDSAVLTNKQTADKKASKAEAFKGESPKEESKGETQKLEKPLSKDTKAKDTTKSPIEKPEQPSLKDSKKLEGFFAFKMSMSTFYNEEGQSLPVTALKYEPCFVSQIKTKEKDSYQAVQMACVPQKNKRCSKALIQHLKPAGFKEGARFIKEIRQSLPEDLKAGQSVSIESLKKGDHLKITALSKGKGFTGVMKRWNFAGGRASHGSKSHRRTGSIGQHTEPARVFPGRKMPGRQGFKKVSLHKVLVVEVLPKESIIFVKGPVPGARNTLVSLQKI